jgi:hypothetical protein
MATTATEVAPVDSISVQELYKAYNDVINLHNFIQEQITSLNNCAKETSLNQEDQTKVQTLTILHKLLNNILFSITKVQQETQWLVGKPLHNEAVDQVNQVLQTIETLHQLKRPINCTK